jgi:hypothetical protein
LLSGLPTHGSSGITIHITDDTMTLIVGDRVVATARFSEHATADGDGAWIVSAHPAQLFTRDRAITALTVAGLGRAGTPTATRWSPRSARSIDRNHAA